jgi:PTS system N-acetylglucosamine-specific IIC component
MKYLQKLGKAIMLPVACLPLCGILMGVGYLLCPASMQGGEMTGALPMIGMFLVKAGGALIDNIAVLFAVGVGVGMADERDGTPAIAALASWLMITTLLKPDNVKPILEMFSSSEAALLAFAKIENPFIGILSGLIGAWSFNRFKDTSLPEWLAFFSGKRSTIIVSGLVSVAASAVLMVIWPTLFGGLTGLGLWIVGMGTAGAGIYAFLNRLLIPVGLHHALNNVFWFDTIGLGDITHYWAGHTSADVSWSLGMYMSGFFPCMMFGVPGAALAMVHCAPREKRKAVIGMVASTALCAFVCGITEPFEFSFMFAAPVLYFVYALLYGIFSFITVLVGFRAGFAFSAGATDLLFSASLPAAQKTWLIIPLGAAAFAAFYLVFRFMITAFNLKTPGREGTDSAGEGSAAVTSAVSRENTTAGAAPVADSSGTSIPESGSSVPDTAEPAREPLIVENCDLYAILDGLGGRQNIDTLDNCVTRLRVEVKDSGAVKDDVLKAAGAKAVVRTGANSVQVVIGLKVQKVADELRKIM